MTDKDEIIGIEEQYTPPGETTSETVDIQNVNLFSQLLEFDSRVNLCVLIEIAKTHNKITSEENQIKLSKTIEVLSPKKYKKYLVQKLEEVKMNNNNNNININTYSQNINEILNDIHKPNIYL